MSLYPSQISLQTFQSILSRYQPLIESLSAAPSKSKTNPKSSPQQALAELDRYRLVELPDIIKERNVTHGKSYLEKEEVEKLIRWKLKHGTFRPTLISLVSSNDPRSITSSTEEAWKCLTAARHNPSSSKTNIINGLICLTSLRGIGPASASLLLSTMDPDEVPFFSDEAYRWMQSGKSSPPSSSMDPWSIKIKYNKAEYEVYLEGVTGLRNRLEVSACEIEKVGFVLGKEKSDLRVMEEDGNNEDEVKNVEKNANEIVNKPQSRSTKRKSNATDEPPTKRTAGNK